MSHVDQSVADAMRAMVAIFNSGDLSALDAMVHPDYLDHQSLDSEQIWSGGASKVLTLAHSGDARIEVTVSKRQ